MGVCRAAVNGEESQWDVAATAFAARGTGLEIGPAQCVDDTIAAMVSKLLAWHEQNPGRQPELTFPQTDGRTACSKDNNSFHNIEHDLIHDHLEYDNHHIDAVRSVRELPVHRIILVQHDDAAVPHGPPFGHQEQPAPGLGEQP
ncbi:Uncharacterised protein [Mycobacteroides abscessus subsp. massiliense]|nr:Uncharacterised protein [Mycobacteroides abscessus subsp. massiliense]